MSFSKPDAVKTSTWIRFRLSPDLISASTSRRSILYTCHSLSALNAIIQDSPHGSVTLKINSSRFLCRLSLELGRPSNTSANLATRQSPDCKEHRDDGVISALISRALQLCTVTPLYLIQNWYRVSSVTVVVAMN